MNLKNFHQANFIQTIQWRLLVKSNYLLEYKALDFQTDSTTIQVKISVLKKNLMKRSKKTIKTQNNSSTNFSTSPMLNQMIPLLI